jgi:hypothetical protein
MTSDRQISANRRNARRSSGPRTTEGKARVGENACRHGLTAMKVRDSATTARITKLRDRILRDGTELLGTYDATLLAEAEIQLQRIMEAELAVLEAALEKQKSLEGRADSTIKDDESQINKTLQIEVFRQVQPQLLSLARYRLRAVGKFRRAVRAICQD